MSNVDAVSSILTKRLSDVASALEKGVPDNYKRKGHNFLLAAMPPKSALEMVFTSSLESKLGNAMEDCAKGIAKITFGNDAVPPIYLGIGATEEDKHHFLNSGSYKKLAANRQVVLTRKNVDLIKAYVETIYTKHRRERGGGGITQDILQKEVVGATYTDAINYLVEPVDLLVCAPGQSTFCMEIKAGGDLDSTKASAETKKLLTVCAAAGIGAGYFSTLYNKNGEGNGFTGAMTEYLASDVIKAGSAFWELILPEDVSFEKFKTIYNSAFQASNIIATLEKLGKEILNYSPDEAKELVDEVLGEENPT
jgi:hypothetical protein